MRSYENYSDGWGSGIVKELSVSCPPQIRVNNRGCIYETGISRDNEYNEIPEQHRLSGNIKLLEKKNTELL